MKVYSNFQEIEQDLRILKLKKKISQEEVRLNLNGAKNGMNLGALSPISSIGTMIGSLLQKAVVAKLLSVIFGYKRVKEVDKPGVYKG